MDSGFLNFLGVFLAIGLSGGVCVGSIFFFKALASRLERPRTSAGEGELVALRMRIEELEEARVHAGELETVSSRVAELEERLDFAERLLTRGDTVQKG